MGLTRIRAEQISDIDYKQAVRVITLSNITLSGGAPATVDGVSLIADDRVLVAGQSTGSQNGLYYVQTVGAGNNGTWVRTTDGNETGEIQAGMIVMVTEGDEYKDTQWKLTTNNPIVIGTTALVFEQNSAYAFGNIYANGTAVLANAVGGTVTLTAGDNIAITGNNTSKTVTIGVTGISLNSIANGTSNVTVVSSGGNVTVGIGGTNNIAVFSTSGADITGYLTVSGNVTGGNMSTSGQIAATGNITGANLSGTLISGTLSTAAQPNITSLGTLSSITVTGDITGGNVSIQNRGILYLYDSDNSNYTGFRSPATLTGNYVYVLPTGYGNNTQVLTTNGAGGLTWEDAGTGGGSGATQYPNSTVQPVPGATGNFDLSFNFVQTSQETPFEATSTDPFGVNLGEVYSMMDPVGEILDPVDLGVLT
jgi:hypothetical protein